MTPRSVVLAAALVLSASGLPAQEHQAEDPMARAVFSPELVLRHAEEIGLKPEQRTGIVNLMKETQAELLDAQVALQELHGKLVKAISSSTTVDEAAVLAMMDGVLGAERNIKRRHMLMLIRVKNLLSREQQDRLQELRKLHGATHGMLEEIRKQRPGSDHAAWTGFHHDTPHPAGARFHHPF